MLQPCSVCRRHVASDEVCCPFCAAPVPQAPRATPTQAGRVSRAAVFASTLAAGCYTSNPPSQYGPPPPPPPDHQPPPPGHPRDEPPYPPHDPPPTDPFAKPPATPTVGSISGFVTFDGGVIARGVDVHARLASQPRQRPLTTHTDDQGQFVFVGLPPGQYRLTISAGTSTATRDVHVASGQSATVNLVASPTSPRSNMPMPYGAPPARARVV